MNVLAEKKLENVIKIIVFYNEDQLFPSFGGLGTVILGTIEDGFFFIKKDNFREETFEEKIKISKWDCSKN